MEKVTKRLFRKIVAAAAAVGALDKLGKYSLHDYAEPREGGSIGMPAEGALERRSLLCQPDVCLLL